MQEEMKSMKVNGVWDLVELPKGINQLVVNGYSKPNRIQKAMSRDIRHA